MAVFCVTEAFSYHEPNGVARVLRPGDLVDEDDPAVGKAPQYFEAVESTVQRATDRREGKEPGDGVIEQATKAPGEKRNVAKPDPADAELDALRAAAEAAGVKVDKRWGADRLRDEIAAAGG
jgi:hypothetical protein